MTDEVHVSLEGTNRLPLQEQVDTLRQELGRAVDDVRLLREQVTQLLAAKHKHAVYIFAGCAALNSCNLGFDIGVSSDVGLEVQEVLGLTEGDRVEVSWQVEMTDGTEEVVWWGATVNAAAEGEEYVLTYEAQHGFGVESRRVIFSSETALWDAQCAVAADSNS